VPPPRAAHPLLAARSLRVDVGGVPAIDGLTVETTGERVLVLGAARALFEAAAGLRATARGSLRIDGAAAIEACRAGLAAGAPLDPPMPPGWTIAQYVAWSARLAGRGRAEARAMASEAIDRLQLAAVASHTLRGAPKAVRRGTVVAAALATGAPALLLDDPLSGLPDDTARAFARVLDRALADRRAVVFAGRVPLDSPLALGADEAIVVDGARVAGRGAPAEIAAAERSYALRVMGDVDAFVRAVRARGGRAEPTADAPPPVHVRVELGSPEGPPRGADAGALPLTPRDLFGLAAEAGAVVLELRPLARALA
jgi:ABC-type multidrug transport system ATPase subunit